ncbi:uncharacterized protein LOC119317082 [Triticum dicoccoides]|uniref:uncharacterized protein LOC119317082 n=1 Tax=Triticum dicoccoides TaxID=85692 RepID=UPI001890B623|nr:uncharacterized protein LOC119317082 [Triticum dicoccoides]XP_044403399.1 uncharacterized protein LOC123127681 isoform X1 [Triticum aestivum]
MHAYLFSAQVESCTHASNSAATMASAASSNNTATPDLDLEAQVPTVSEIARSVFPGASPTKAQLATSLWAVGSASFAFGMSTAFHPPQAGPIFGPVFCYLILAVVVATAAAEMATSVFLHIPALSGKPRLQAFARRLLPCGYLVLLVSVSASGLAIPFKP